MPKDKKVYVIGMGGLEEELRNEGISYIGGTVRNICMLALNELIPLLLRTR